MEGSTPVFFSFLYYIGAGGDENLKIIWYDLMLVNRAFIWLKLSVVKANHSSMQLIIFINRSKYIFCDFFSDIKVNLLSMPHPTQYFIMLIPYQMDHEQDGIQT